MQMFTKFKQCIYNIIGLFLAVVPLTGSSFGNAGTFARFNPVCSGNEARLDECLTDITACFFKGTAGVICEGVTLHTLHMYDMCKATVYISNLGFLGLHNHFDIVTLILSLCIQWTALMMGHKSFLKITGLVTYAHQSHHHCQLHC